MAADTTTESTATLWRPALAEFFATMLFVFIGPAAVVAALSLNDGKLSAAGLVGIAIAHGLAIVAGVSATANISGGHINPAVTIAALVTGKVSVNRAVFYIIAQLVGAVVGSILLSLAIPAGSPGNLGAHGLGAGMDVGKGIITEIVLTFALVAAVFATAVDPRGLGHVAPLAIGFTVLIDHLAGVPLTGASMNPARSFGPWLLTMNVDFATHALVYWVGPIVGGIIAALIYEKVYMHRPE